MKRTWNRPPKDQVPYPASCQMSDIQYVYAVILMFSCGAVVWCKKYRTMDCGDQFCGGVRGDFPWSKSRRVSGGQTSENLVGRESGMVYFEAYYTPDEIISVFIRALVLPLLLVVEIF